MFDGTVRSISSKLVGISIDGQRGAREIIRENGVDLFRRYICIKNKDTFSHNISPFCGQYNTGSGEGEERN